MRFSINRANGETPIKQNWTIPCRAIKLLLKELKMIINNTEFKLCPINNNYKRYTIIYYKQIEDLTTMADECKPVE